MEKREKFVISLRKKKTADIIEDKRRKNTLLEQIRIDLQYDASDESLSDDERELFQNLFAINHYAH